jgi:pullulanase
VRLYRFFVWLPVLVVSSFLPISSAANASEPISVRDRIDPESYPDQSVLIVHYHRPDGNYGDWNLWAWADGQPGQRYDFDGETAFSRYATLVLPDDVPLVGMIVREGEWISKDVDRDRFARLSRGGVAEIWLVAGNDRVFTSPASVDLSPRVYGAFLDGPDLIHFTTSAPMEAGALDRIVLEDREGRPSRYEIVSVETAPIRSARGTVYQAKLSSAVEMVDLGHLVLNPPDMDATTVFARDALVDERFTALDAVLGPNYSPTSTTFRTWSPVADSVDLLLFEEPDSKLPFLAVPLERDDRGVWETTVDGNFHGMTYQYWFKSYGVDRVTADIHSLAATQDSFRSVVIDPSKLNPAGWGSVPTPPLAQPTDEIIYEIHVRDFSVADESLSPELRGTYAGLTHRGSVEIAGRNVQTGLNHLEELGITAVHLLPIQDFTAPLDQYNWGYWTALFNAAESNYSTNPADPLQAVRDLKSAIQGLHEAGIRVILDVVYNHTSTSYELSPFDQSVPYYYFRTTIDGSLRNDAGVGNSIADERPMVRKYIGDSLEYWTREYRIDGYRFDLLGTHRPESVREWVQRIRAIRPDATIYGEPWTGGGPIYFPKGAQRGMEIAVFNDHLRNAIRGDLDGTAQGYATGPDGDLGAIRRGVMGAIDDFTDHPSETINYASAHDNLTLWDKILITQPGATEQQHQAMQKFSHAIVLTSQGIAFIHGGADYARTKGGNHNSYDAGDEVNRFDWARKAEYAEVVNYIAGLIELRRAYPEFRLADRDAVRESLRWRGFSPRVPRQVVAFMIDSGEGRTLQVIYNGTDAEQTVPLQPGQWQVLADAESAGSTPIRNTSAEVTLPGYSAMVLVQQNQD